MFNVNSVVLLIDLIIILVMGFFFSLVFLVLFCLFEGGSVVFVGSIKVGVIEGKMMLVYFELVFEL